MRKYSCRLNRVLSFPLMKPCVSAVFSSQVLAYTLSCVCTSAFSAGIIEAVEAEDIMNKLRLLVDNNRQVEFLLISLWVSGCFEVLVLIYSDFDFLMKYFFVPRNEKRLILIQALASIYRHLFLSLSPIDTFFFFGMSMNVFLLSPIIALYKILKHMASE